MNIGQYVHIGQQFQLCVTILREDLLESTDRSVLWLQGCSIIDHLSLNKFPSGMFSWCWITWKKELPNKSDFPDKLLTFKVTMLLALRSASRVRALHILVTRFMVKTLQQYDFKFQKLHKSRRQGLKPITLEFVAFSQDKDLCVVSALDEYLNRTEELTIVNNETQLPLSYIQPHKQVVQSTILGWHKNVLKFPGINIALFTAHSTRWATISKTSASALSVIEILEQGT